MRMLSLALLGLVSYSSVASAAPSAASPLAFIDPLSPYQRGENLEWRRYLHLDDGHLVATTQPEWKPKLEVCFQQVWSEAKDGIPQHWLNLSRLHHEGSVFGIEKDDIFNRSIMLSQPDELDLSALLYPTTPSAAYEKIRREELFKLCVRQSTGASLTTVSIPFRKGTGKQLEYQFDAKEYRPATINIDHVSMVELYQQNGRWLSYESTLPANAIRHCTTSAFDRLTSVDESQRDIAFLKPLYFRSFQHYVQIEKRVKQNLNLSEEELKRHTDGFLDSQPPLMRMANTAINRYDNCLKTRYSLSPDPKQLFVDSAHRLLLRLDLIQHRFVKARDLSQSTDGTQ